MDAGKAIRALGPNRTRIEVRHMVKALSIAKHLNSAEESARLEAGSWALKNWRLYTEAASIVRNSKRSRSV